jgi:hypothetical protein
MFKNIDGFTASHGTCVGHTEIAIALMDRGATANKEQLLAPTVSTGRHGHTEIAMAPPDRH